MLRSLQHFLAAAIAACLLVALPFWSAPGRSWMLESLFATAQFLWIWAGVLSFFFSDVLIRHLYSNHYQLWTELGKPGGFFWVPPDGSWWRKVHTLRVSNELLFGKVAEPNNDEIFRRIRRKYVFAVGLSIIAGLCVLPAFFTLAM